MMKIISFYFSIKMLFIIYIPVALIFCFIKRKNKHNNEKHTLNYYLFYIFYAMVLVDVVVLPITIVYGASPEEIQSMIGDSWRNIQLIPFESIRYEMTYQWGWVQIFGNFILLIPFAVWQLFKEGRSAVKVLLISASLSIVIELQQLLNNYLTKYPSHAIDIDDVILNVTGVIAAILFYKYVWKKIKANSKACGGDNSEAKE